MSTPGTTQERLARRRDPTPPNSADPGTWRDWPLDHVQRPPAHMPPGPALILGGAGTGKTHTLLGRALHLARSGVNSSTITIIAPHARAAQDMRRRLFPVIGSDPFATGIYVRTFEDLCLSDLLRPSAAWNPTLPPDFSLWTRGQSLDALAQIVNSDPRDQTGKMGYPEVAQVLDWISDNAYLSAQHRTPPARDEWHGYAAAYRRAKQDQGSLDGADLLVATRDALRNDPALRDFGTQDLTRHLLVDNFEDVTPIQYQLIRLLTGPEKSVCVAMDPNQAVRRPGSALSHSYKQFTTNYAKDTVFQLDVNHRASASIMRSWQRLAQHHEMTGLVDDRQRGLRPENRQPEVIAVDGTPQDQYRRIAQDVKGLIVSETFHPEQIAILARTRTSLLRLAPHLEAAGIPFAAFGDFIGAGDPEVQPALAMLTLAVNPKNVWAFLRAAEGPPDGLRHNLSPAMVRDVLDTAGRLGTDLITAADHVRANLPPNSIAHRTMSRTIELCRELQSMMTTTIAPVAPMLELVHLRFHGADPNRDPPPFGDDMTRLMARARNLDDIKRARAHARASRGEDPAPAGTTSTLVQFLDQMTNDTEPLSSDDGKIPRPSWSPGMRPPPGPPRVSLATMRMTKGMEWPAVVVADAADHVVPGDRSHDDPAIMAVEQRLFYTAVSRAADWYALYWARQREDGTETAPCRFIEPLLG